METMSTSSPSSSNPESLNSLNALLPSLTPANLARHHSRGLWTFAPHLKPLNEQAIKLATGTVKRAIWTLPPRWGKSTIACYFGAWFMGVVPNAQIIITSAEAELALQWSRKIRDILSEVGREVFGVNIKPDSMKQGHWETSAGGVCHAAGAGGPLTGRGATLIIADDLIKNSEQANSEAFRATLMDWWTSTVMTRLEPGGRVLLIGTRWRVDDVIGQLLEQEKDGGDHWDLIVTPALDAAGESTSTRYTTEEMLQKKAGVGAYTWETMYMGAPYVRTGGFFDVDKIETVDAAPVNLVKVRGWDEASSLTGDYTVGIKLGKAADGNIYILDMARCRLAPGPRDAEIQKTVERDGSRVRQHFQQEPGSAGLSRIEAIKNLLRGYWVTSDKPTGDKETRAGASATAVDTGIIKMVRGAWNAEFLEEMRAFPNGAHDDIPDAFSWAYEIVKDKGNDLGKANAPLEPDRTFTHSDSNAHIRDAAGYRLDDKDRPGYRPPNEYGLGLNVTSPFDN